MNKRSSYLLKNVGILTISNFASRILVFLMVPLYTSVLSTVDVGGYDLIVSTVSLLYPILTCNISDAVMRFSMDREYSRDKVTNIGSRFVVISIGIFALFLWIISKLGFWNQINGLEWYILLFYVFFVLHQFLIQVAKGYEQVAAMGIAGGLSTVVMVLSNVLLLWVFRLGLPGFFIANILSHAVPVVYFIFKLKLHKQSKKNTAINKNLCKNMLAYCMPLIFTAIGWWVNSSSDRYVVSLMCGVAANGILSVAYKMPQIINTLQGIFIQAWQISAIKEYGNNDTPSFYGKSFSVMNLMMSIACSLLILLAKPIGKVLYANEFYVAWQYTPFLLISCVLNSASGFLGPILSAKKDSRSMALSAIYGSAANIVLNIAFVYLIGVQGVTIATAVSSYIIFVIRKRAVGKAIQFEKNKVIFLSWLLLVTQACIEVYTSLWYVEILLIIIILIMNWVEVDSIFRTVLKLIFKHKREERAA